MEEFSKEYNIRRTFGGYYIASIPLKDIPKLKDDLRVRRIYYTKMWLH